MNAKERHKLKLIEYLANPEKDWLTRELLSTVVLGFAHGQGIHKTFTAAELNEIEREALDIRRTKYAKYFASIDAGQLKRAIDDPTAAKLMYQRFEGWSEKQDLKLTGDITVEIVKFGEGETPK